MGVNFEEIAELDSNSLLDDIVSLYSRIWDSSMFRQSQKDAETFGITLGKHSSREGFKLCTARDADGELIGFAYGYRGMPDQWWYRNVSRFFLTHEIDEWMLDYFEFVELGVGPEYRGSGIGTALHNMLLDNLPYRTAMLSTQTENTSAIRLYEKMKWLVVKSNILFPGSDVSYVIMGKKLAKP